MTRNLPLPGTVSNFDVISSSGGGHTRHAELADATEHVIGDAIAAAPVPNAWVRSSRGDGEVSVAPADVPAAWLVADFLNEVYAGAMRYNRNKRDDDRLRLRVGIDCGDVLVNGRGDPHGGMPLVRAARLQESPAARAAAAALPEAPLVAVLSDEVYQRVVPHQERGLRPQEFRRVAVDVEGGTLAAWLYVPHFPPPAVDGAAGPAPRAGSAAGKYTVTVTGSEATSIGDHQTNTFYTGGSR